MAGHSKWANIQHRKGRQDSIRGRLFSRLVREVSVAARLGGGSPDANPRLRWALEAANASNIPKSTLERAINKAIAANAEGQLEDTHYEGFGPAGSAFIVHCLTSNLNRAIGEVRAAFKKGGGNLGVTGSVSHMFQRLALFSWPQETDRSRLFELAVEAGATDMVDKDNGGYEVHAEPDDYARIRDVFEQAGLPAAHGVLTMQPLEKLCMSEDETMAVSALYDCLDELEDVQTVYCNINGVSADSEDDETN